MEQERPPLYSNVQPVWRFGVLCLATFGFYELYWFYKNWKWLKEKQGLKVRPFWRTFFAPLFSDPLFKRISALAQERGAPPMRSPGGFAALYFLLCLSWRLPSPYSLLSSLTFLPLIPAVRTLNAYWELEQAELPVRDHFSVRERILVTMGLIAAVFAVIGILAPMPPSP